MALTCLYMLLKTSGHAPDGSWMVSWGPPPRPGSGHQWAPDGPWQYLATLDAWYITSHRCSIGFRSGEQEGHWYQCLHHPGPAYILWPHEARHCLHPEEPRAYSTSFRSDNCSEDLIPVPNSSPGTVGYDMEVCVTLEGYTTSDHHWPTNKPIMLEDFTGSITFTMASPDSFMSVTCAQCEPALICEENWVPPANSGVSNRMAIEQLGMGLWG